ncbi:hypothetical protein GJ496_009694 [Pomphorhynchus laevis]|nr:hypothetical protein GJ496_009694 [Pomphorhynchus laevis]
MRPIETKESITIPADVDVKIKARKVTVKGPRGVLERDFSHCTVIIRKVGQTISVEKCNMIKGVTKGFRYKMRGAYAHFPINCVAIENGNVLEIRNFLGEKITRKIPMLPGVTVTVSKDVKDQLVLEGNSIGNVSQSAASIHHSVLVKKKDIRCFLDGIYNSLLLREVVLELESLSSDDSSSNKGFSIPRICSLIINAPCIFLGQLDENDYQLKVLSTLADELLTDAPIISTILLCKSCILGWKNLPVFLRTNGAKLSLVCDILVKGTYAGSHINNLEKAHIEYILTDAVTQSNEIRCFVLSSRLLCRPLQEEGQINLAGILSNRNPELLFELCQRACDQWSCECDEQEDLALSRTILVCLAKRPSIANEIRTQVFVDVGKYLSKANRYKSATVISNIISRITCPNNELKFDSKIMSLELLRLYSKAASFAIPEVTHIDEQVRGDDDNGSTEDCRDSDDCCDMDDATNDDHLDGDSDTADFLLPFDNFENVTPDTCLADFLNSDHTTTDFAKLNSCLQLANKRTVILNLKAIIAKLLKSKAVPDGLITVGIRFPEMTCNILIELIFPKDSGARDIPSRAKALNALIEICTALSKSVGVTDNSVNRSVHYKSGLAYSAKPYYHLLFPSEIDENAFSNKNILLHANSTVNRMSTIGYKFLNPLLEIIEDWNCWINEDAGFLNLFLLSCSAIVQYTGSVSSAIRLIHLMELIMAKRHVLTENTIRGTISNIFNLLPPEECSKNVLLLLESHSNSNHYDQFVQ